MISQRLCGLMGGTVRAESSPDHGSAFIFTIRTAAAEVSADSGLPPLPALLREGTVLCVDDHPVTQARLRTLFEKWGVKQVLVATDATAALALAAQLPAPPALLVVDHSGGESAPPFASLDAIACPRLLLCPFGQTAPVAPAGQPPFASSTKPIRTSYLTHAVVALFHPRAADSDAAAKKTERPIGEEIPLVVLLAEDNAVNQKVALRFLERLGYRADAVANGLEAVTTAEGRNYDLVLMDVQMPEMDGYEATRQIRARLPAHRQPKIFALTANAMEGDRALCVAAGMDDHISKPVKMHEIAAAIRRHFGRP